ncbi:MAG: Asp23/Gls24 family envelope stress response protein [Pseudonocardiaceae bacterium]
MTAAATDPQPPAPAADPDAEPGERGRLRIDPSVVRKIAEHIADLAPETRPAPRTVAGVGIGRTGATSKVSLAVQGVDLYLELALRYPGPVRSAVDQLRNRINEEVQRITGYQVGSVSVTVTALLPEPSVRVQ